jgi:beta-fructofuranosidase
MLRLPNDWIWDSWIADDGDRYHRHMLITARVKGTDRNDDGVLAHARSTNLRTWELGLPTSEPAGLARSKCRWFASATAPRCWCTCHPEGQTDERKRRYGLFSTWSVIGESVTSPWDISRAVPFSAEPALFAAPLVQQRDGTWAFVGFRNLEREGHHDFEILDPIPIALVAGALTATHVSMIAHDGDVPPDR